MWNLLSHGGARFKMSFQAFAAEHGLIIRDLEIGKWVRVPTLDHPEKRNGSYIFDGDKGAVQNWAVHERPVSWFSDHREWIDTQEYQRKKELATKEKERKQKEAVRKAVGILKNAVQSTHPYLVKKGFSDTEGIVWKDLLVVPMRVGQNLVGCQLIDKDGTKKFLSGQITKGAHCGFDNKGKDILVEGFATALSIRRALKAAKTRYKLWVCFSASNIIEVAKGLQSGLVVADNDLAGINAAKKTGFDYWVSDVEGEDFNDYELRTGTQDAGLNLAKRLMD
jgi:putative DNA primase/helicase